MVVAVAVGGSALASGVTGMMAGDAQAKGAGKGADAEREMYERTRADLRPYNEAGYDATERLRNRLTELTSPIVMDQAALEKTPGYQFTLAQSLKSVQNSAAARGLGNSGAAFKGAAEYATGLADSTYQNQFANALTNQQGAYDKLMGVAGLGANAAAQTGQAGSSAAAGMRQAYTDQGTARAAGLNKLGGALSDAAGTYGGYQMGKQRGLYG